MLHKKKIIILGSAYPLRGGGIATFNERLAKAFQEETENAWDVSIYSFKLQYPSFLFPGTSQYSNEAAPEHLDIVSAMNSINPINWIRVGNTLRTLKPDIIVVRYWLPFMGPCLGTILRIVKRNKYTKIICIADNIIPHEKRILDKQFTNYFVKPIDAFITMSEKVYQDVALFSTKKRSLLVHPIYDTFGKGITKQEACSFLKIDVNTSYLLFFGFIRKYKGLDILLHALAILKKENMLTTKKCIIAGEFYEDSQMYINLIQELQLEEHILLKNNFITDSEVKYYFCACDAVIQPYKNATQSGITPLAFHFNKPSIVTNVGGLAGFIQHNKTGLIAEPNAVDIATKIKEFYTLNQEELAKNIEEEKKKYSWKTIVDTIVTLSN